jgi:hypothetical protein
MAITNVTNKFFTWFLRRSPAAADKPDVTYEVIVPPAVSGDAQPPVEIERYTDIESIIGTSVQSRLTETGLVGPDGRLLREHNRASVLLGCYHVVTSVQGNNKDGVASRHVAGQCVFCCAEQLPALQSAAITRSDFDRLTAFCNECARMTASGQLCCARHAISVPTPDGRTLYLTPDEAEASRRQGIVAMVFEPLKNLFMQEPQSHKEDPS